LVAGADGAQRRRWSTAKKGVGLSLDSKRTAGGQAPALAADASDAPPGVARAGAAIHSHPAHEALQIGARLRELRLRHRHSIGALAHAAGWTHSTVARIEANKTSPSVMSMKRILSALGVSQSEFFAQGEAQPEEQMFFAAAELASGTSVSCRQVGQSRLGKAIAMLHERYAPGADAGDAIGRQAQQSGIVVRSRIVATVGIRERILAAGDAFYFRSQVPYRWHNPFHEECELVRAVSPPDV
jgi:transcriptional regulator with XRE-family HTH domain